MRKLTRALFAAAAIVPLALPPTPAQADPRVADRIKIRTSVWQFLYPLVERGELDRARFNAIMWTISHGGRMRPEDKKLPMAKR